MSIRILLADDHQMVREGIRSLLEKEHDIEVVGEAEEGRKAVELVKQLQPDMIVMDITMPNLNGVDATQQIVSEFPQTKVVALSMHFSRIFVLNMLKAGALGYILKGDSSEELIEGIRTVSEGGAYFSPKAAKTVTEVLANPLPDSPLDVLTLREREVFQLICEGKNTKQIALELHVSIKTIEANRRKLIEKLGANSIPELVIIAIENGVISLER
ncbi:MAG: response regulator transcription factor [Planctomycetota bacterium]|jgi:DNA-binding NarL/FixJ family response regulator